jgi:hypothetical protein
MRIYILKINHNQLSENSERQGSRLFSSVAGADHFSQTDRKKVRGLLPLLHRESCTQTQRKVKGLARGCAKGARAHPLEKKWLEGNIGLKNDRQGRQVFPLAGTPPPPCYAPGTSPPPPPLPNGLISISSHIIHDIDE